MIFPAMLLFVLWVIEIIEQVGGFHFSWLGVYPRKWEGLVGIITSPLIHSDFSHLTANSVPLLILGSALFYFYRDVAFRVLLLIWLLTGIWVWFGARPAYHIGASGVVYGLSTFIFVSGLIRRHTGLMAMALVVIFLYGSLIWGIFPEFFPEENISWESHLFGIISGVVLAFFFRREGPQRRKYEWEIEEEEEDEEDDENDGDAFWKSTISDEDVKKIRRVYRRTPED